MEIKKSIKGLLGIAIFGIACMFFLAGVGAVSENITQKVYVKVLPGNVFVTSPVEGAVYTNRVVLVEANTGDETVQFIKYKDRDEKPEIRLCKNCKSTSKKKSFDDGFHELFFSAALPEGIIYQNVAFWVDSRAPVVKKTSPTKGFASEEFTIQFYEVNPRQVLFTYGNNTTGYRTAEVNLSSCVETRNTWTCSVQVDLTDYDLEDMTYWFSVYDVALRGVFSKMRTVAVDLSQPVIENVNYTINKKEVSFVIDIDELNFKTTSYIDAYAKRPVKVVLCRELEDGQCVGKKRFASGSHDVTIEVEDAVGNTATKNVRFEI